MTENLENLQIEYVQSNTCKPDDDSNVKKDGFEVLCENFLFYRRRTIKDSSYWVFISRSKKPHNIQEDGGILDKNDVHVPLNEFQITSLQFIKKVKLRCSTEDVGSNKIFEDEQNKLFKLLKTDAEKNAFASLIPQFQKSLLFSLSEKDFGFTTNKILHLNIEFFTQ
ncbi:unnamed protein product [Brachionus calyciflorus]|uniref:Uncharacterized protein n=1 Tax=Brachionus calyciflorus TaxID=104777 RepID=A0A814F4G1_9BILA|nr:unnamed protein product [Brachionus calyciflorus]